MNEQRKARSWQWLYDHAITGLAAIAFGAWALNVRDAKNAYVSGQEAMVKAQTQIIENQKSILEQLRVMERSMDIVKERQDRNTTLIIDHEDRIRELEGNHR